MNANKVVSTLLSVAFASTMMTAPLMSISALFYLITMELATLILLLLSRIEECLKDCGRHSKVTLQAMKVLTIMLYIYLPTDVDDRTTSLVLLFYYSQPLVAIKLVWVVCMIYTFL